MENKISIFDKIIVRGITSPSPTSPKEKVEEPTPTPTPVEAAPAKPSKQRRSGIKDLEQNLEKYTGISEQGFSELFGMPVRDYAYDASSELARARTMTDIFAIKAGAAVKSIVQENFRKGGFQDGSSFTKWAVTPSLSPHTPGSFPTLHSSYQGGSDW